MKGKACTNILNMRRDDLAPTGNEREGQRIAKLLARAGIASRRDIERMIEERRIAINGDAVETPATLLTSLHGVTVDGMAVREPAPARLFRYHKPPGLLTAARDPAGRPTIYDRLPQGLPRLMPVGRLDMNTEGLLLLTTDGELKRQLELPSTGVERTYRARVFGDVSQEQLEDLIHGIEIEGVRYGSIDANLERRTGRNGWVEMRLTEGKNREVRRVLEHLGLQVSRLLRIAYGPFVLGDLQPGDVDEVRQHDLVEFKRMLGGKTAHAPIGEFAATRPTPAPRRKTPPAPRATPVREDRGEARPRPAFSQRTDRPDRGEPRPFTRTGPKQGRPDRSDARASARPSSRGERPDHGETRSFGRSGPGQERPERSEARGITRPGARTERPDRSEARPFGRSGARQDRPGRAEPRGPGRSGARTERLGREERGPAKEAARTDRRPSARDERPGALVDRPKTLRPRTDRTSGGAPGGKPGSRGGRPGTKGPRPTGRGAPKR